MEPRPKLLKILDGLAIIMLGAAIYMVFVFAPIELNMGNIQRIFYFHVSAGWTGMIGFLVAVFAGIAFLRTSNRKWDIIGLAGIEIGLVFSFINIATGSIWAKGTWNTWWRWEDPRLVTASIMELVYFGYLMLRQGIEDPNRRARFGAVYAIIGFISVPMSFMSIRIWQSKLHPDLLTTSETSGAIEMAMTDPMQITFFFSLLTFTILGVALVWHRIRIGMLAEKVEQLKLKLSS